MTAEKRLIKPQYTAQTHESYGDVPQDVQAEQFVLSALMITGEKQEQWLDFTSEKLSEKDFFSLAHQRIFAAMLQVHDSPDDLDIVTLRAYIEASGWMEEAGGLLYVMSLLDFAPTAANIPYYAEKVRKEALRRRMIEFCAQVRGAAFDPETDPLETIARAETLIFAVKDILPGADAGFETAEEIATEYLADLADRMQTGNIGINGLRTGLSAVDQVLAGLKKKKLYILAGRPSMGKTSAVLTVALNVAQAGGVVAAFLLEGSKSDAIEGVLSQMGQVNNRKMQLAKLDTSELGKLRDAQQDLAGLPLEFEDSSGLTISQLRSRLRRLKARRGRLDLVIVDYLQIMRGESKQAKEDKTAEVGEIAQGLKAVAKDFDVPVFAVASLNRGVENREDKRPKLSDLSESGKIEYEADSVSFLYRPSYYAAKEENSESVSHTAIDEVEWIVAKNKKGPTGFVKVGFRPAYTQFVDLEENRGF